jgi:hypothetical protein
MDLLTCDVVFVSATLSVLQCLGVKLCRGAFTKFAKVDLVVAVVPDTGGHTGGLCLYQCSLNSLEVFFVRLLTWEYWQLVISSLISPDFSINVYISERK